MMKCASLILLNMDFVSTPKTCSSKFISNADFDLIVIVVESIMMVRL